MAEKFGFYEHCLFHTTVEATTWDEDVRPLDRRDRSRRQDAGALRDPGQRHPDDAEAGAHRRHGEVQGRVVPHLALGLQHRPARQDGRHHRHRRDGGAGGPGAREDRRRALRVPAHAVLDRRARPARDDRRRAGDLGQRARMGPGKARALREDLGRPHRHPGQRRLPGGQGPGFQGAQEIRRAS